MCCRATGKPQQNAYIERFNRTVRGEWLGQYIFETIEEAQDQATEWLWTYNNERPKMGIGGITPAMKLKTAAWILRLHPIKNGGITVPVKRGLSSCAIAWTIYELTVICSCKPWEADDPPWEQINHDGQIRPTFVCLDVGDVRHPERVWGIYLELSVERIVSDDGWFAAIPTINVCIQSVRQCPRY
jgi:putative transposase